MDLNLIRKFDQLHISKYNKLVEFIGVEGIAAKSYDA